MSGSVDTADILVIVDKGDQYNVNLQPPDQYGITINSGDTYVVNIDLPTTITATQANSYYRVADYAVTASYVSGSQVSWDGLLGKPSGIVSSSTQINQLTDVSSSYASTASYALNAGGTGTGFPFSGSAVITGSLIVSGGTILGTASISQEILGGKSRYIPLWTGSSQNELTSSIIYQTTKGIFIGYDTNPHFHSAEGETLAVHSGETGVKNVIYAHGTIDDDYRVNIRNISSGVSASTNFKATADVGNDLGGFVELGINSSTYARTDQLGGPLDAYLFTTGSDLLIGNLSPDKRIILFTGPGDADNNARVYIDPSGSVGINTSEVIAGAPDALRVKAVPSVSTFNVITAIGLTDDYAQINMKNTGVGNSVSSDIVATANNGSETTNFVNMGINGETYTGTIGGPNDSYVYSTGGHLHLGVIDPSEEVRLFVGGNDTTLTTKLTLRDTNQHELSGSLNVTGSLNVLEGVVNNLTASFALTASYVSGAASDWFTLSNKPEGLVSSSTQATSWTVLSASFASTASNLNFTPATASFATSASFAPTNVGVVSSSTQITYTQLQNIPSGIVSSSGQIVTLLPAGTVSSSLQINTGSFSGSFTGTFTGTSSFSTSASRAITSSFVLPSGLPVGIISSSTQVTTALPSGVVSSSAQINTGSFSGSFTGAFTGTSSFAVSASRAITASYVLPSGLPSGVVSSSAQVISALPNGTVSSSTQINTGSFSGSFTGTLIGTSSWATSASFAPTNAGVVSSSTQIDYTQIQNKPTTIATASFVEYANVANKPTLVSASSQIQLNAVSGVTFSNASFLFPQNLKVEGTLTAQEIRTEFVTSSVIFESGSTKFGDSADDTHQFTGSLTVLGTISGSIILPQGIVSSSTQAIGWTVATASFVEYINVANKPSLISSSVQVSYTQLQNIPVGIVSSSVQINTGSFSGSITSASFATSASWAPTVLPSGIVSSSAQINTGSFSGSFIGTFNGTASFSNIATTASYISGGVVIIGLPTDGAYGGSAGNVSGISTGDKAEDAFDKIEVILGKLAPAKPANLSSRTLTTNATTYTAFSASGATPISYTNVTANSRPTASWTFSAATSGSSTTLTYDADAGTLQAEVDGVVAPLSQDVFTTASDVGTFGDLIITADLDPYNGTFGQQGFWKGFIASVAATRSLALGPHTYRLLHSTTGNTPLFTWYLDNPSTPTVTLVTGSSAGGSTRYVSGVPTLATGETVIISTTASNAISQFYNGTRILAAVGNNSVAPSVNATLPASPPISASVASASVTLTVANNAYSVASTYTVTAYNSAGTTATSTWTPSSPIRVDTISNESSRCRSGIGWYPAINSTVSGAGAPWTASANLTGSRDLQMTNNSYHYPSASNYSTNYPTPGPNYIGLVAETTASFPGEAVRWVTFSGSVNAASNINVTFNSTSNFVGIATTGSMRLYVLVSGSGPTNGWIDASTSYPGTGNPLNNGDPALDFGNSTTTIKRVTFGSIVKTGVVFVRVGIPSSSLAGSNRTFSGVTITQV